MNGGGEVPWTTFLSYSVKVCIVINIGYNEKKIGFRYTVMV